MMIPTIGFTIPERGTDEQLLALTQDWRGEKGGKFDHDLIQGPMLVLAAAHGRQNLVQAILQGLSEEKLNKIIERAFNGDKFSPLSKLIFFVGRGQDPRPYENAALLYASQRGHNGIINQLLAFGVDINIKGNYNDLLQTPLMCAVGCGHLETVRLLIQNGASLKLTDHDGKTALDHARELNQFEIVKLLEEAEFEEAKTEQSWQQSYVEQDNLPD
jgi:ankyrin repeat protein